MSSEEMRVECPRHRGDPQHSRRSVHGGAEASLEAGDRDPGSVPEVRRLFFKDRYATVADGG